MHRPLASFALAALALLPAASLWGQDPRDGARPVPAASNATLAELLDTFHAVMPAEPSDLRRADVRRRVAPEALPVLERLIALTAGDDGHVPFVVYALALGDPRREQTVAVAAVAGEPGARAQLAVAAAIAAETAAARVVALDALRAHMVAPDGAQTAALRALLVAGGLDATEARALAQAAGTGPLAVELRAAAERWETNPARAVGRPFVCRGVTLDGRPWSSAEALGKVLVVDLWATWCRPCVAALPELVALRRDLGARGVVVLGATCDGDRQALEGFLAKRPDVDWPQLVPPALLAPTSGAPASGRSEPVAWHPLATELGVTTIPCVLVVDRKGVLRHAGPPAGLRATVEALLAE